MISIRSNLRAARSAKGFAFTLIELIVVLGIIGLILALSLPHFRHMNEGRSMEGAVRQLLDDLAYARQTAIATRSTVALVFISPEIQDSAIINPFDLSLYSTNERANILDLQAGALTTYGVFAFRKAGDQPGQNAAHYLGQWRSFPEKVFIAEAKFDSSSIDGFRYDTFRFPNTTSSNNVMPYVAFNAQGQCLPLKTGSPFSGLTDPTKARDVYIPLANGVIMYTRNSDGTLASWSAQEIPPNNSVNVSNVIRIDWLTGRAKLERADVTRQ